MDGLQDTWAEIGPDRGKGQGRRLARIPARRPGHEPTSALVIMSRAHGGQYAGFTVEIGDPIGGQAASTWKEDTLAAIRAIALRGLSEKYIRKHYGQGGQAAN